MDYYVDLVRSCAESHVISSIKVLVKWCSFGPVSFLLFFSADSLCNISLFLNTSINYSVFSDPLQGYLGLHTGAGLWFRVRAHRSCQVLSQIWPLTVAGQSLLSHKANETIFKPPLLCSGSPGELWSIHGLILILPMVNHRTGMGGIWKLYPSHCKQDQCEVPYIYAFIPTCAAFLFLAIVVMTDWTIEQVCNAWLVCCSFGVVCRVPAPLTCAYRAVNKIADHLQRLGLRSHDALTPAERDAILENVTLEDPERLIEWRRMGQILSNDSYGESFAYRCPLPPPPPPPMRPCTIPQHLCTPDPFIFLSIIMLAHEPN